jgi:hypothetical protein
LGEDLVEPFCSAGNHFGINDYVPKLQAMTDQQLLDYGRDCGEMCADKYMRVSFEPDPWLEKLREARAEWRRRYPKK